HVEAIDRVVEARQALERLRRLQVRELAHELRIDVVLALEQERREAGRVGRSVARRRRGCARIRARRRLRRGLARAEREKGEEETGEGRDHDGVRSDGERGRGGGGGRRRSIRRRIYLFAPRVSRARAR